MTAAALLARNKTRLTGRPVDLFLSFWCPIFPLPSEPRIRWFSGSFRHARQLAEGQKSADVQHFRIALPPLRPPIELAEWVKFPEKNADLWSLRPSFGGGGSPGWIAARLWA